MKKGLTNSFKGGIVRLQTSLQGSKNGGEKDMAKYAYAFLFGEMAKKHLSADDLGKIIGIQGRTMRNKLNGLTDFTWSEVCKIHDMFPQYTKEELFQRDP